MGAVVRSSMRLPPPRNSRTAARSRMKTATRAPTRYARRRMTSSTPSWRAGCQGNAAEPDLGRGAPSPLASIEGGRCSVAAGFDLGGRRSVAAGRGGGRTRSTRRARESRLYKLARPCDRWNASVEADRPAVAAGDYAQHRGDSMIRIAGHRSRDLERIAGVAIAVILTVPLMARADTLTLLPTQDSWIAEGSPNANHENDNVLHVRTGSTAVKQRALVQFDLSAVPSCGVVSSAVLRLTITNPPPTSRTEGVHKVSKAWTEAGVTWNSTNGATLWTAPGGDFTVAATSTATTGITDMAVIQWTVTSDVLAFI